MKWPPTVPKDCPLTLVSRGYMARLGGKPRWICGKRPLLEAMKIYHRKALEYGSHAAAPMPAPKASNPDNATMYSILNRWALARRQDCAEGKINAQTFNQYRLSANRIDKIIGHYKCSEFTPEHTEELHRRLVKAHTADGARRAIGHLRDCCRYAAERRWCRPVLFGEKIASALAARPAAEMKWKLYTPAQIQSILKACRDQMKDKGGIYLDQHRQFYAILLLALNGGYGSREASQLLKTDIDLSAGMIEAKRGKTGVRHIVPLWDETAKALKPVLLQRPDDPLLFRTMLKNPWCYERPKMKAGKIIGFTSNDNVADRFNDLVDELGIRFEGQSFYKLKHLSNTTADAAGDPHATFALYGHSLGVKGHYVAVGIDRLRKVTEFVRAKLLHG